jgi:hypothetical protein
MFVNTYLERLWCRRPSSLSNFCCAPVLACDVTRRLLLSLSVLLKMIILPRQARDKHREQYSKKMAF